MKKILFIGLIFGAFSAFGQTDSSVIHLFDQTIVEEFKSLDKDGNEVTSYRRMDRQKAGEYIERIRAENQSLQERLEMFRNEEKMYKSMMDDMKARKAEVQATIQENKRRIEEYKKYLR